LAQEIEQEISDRGGDMGAVFQRYSDRELGKQPSKLVERLKDRSGRLGAYHGSPHTFDAFSMEKIGTGEGAQAYGHGLYFAENPKVAAEYARNVRAPTAPPRRFFRGQELEPGTPEYKAAMLLDGPGNSLASVKSEVRGWIANARPGEDVAHYKQTLATLESAAKKGEFTRKAPRGSTYKVSIDANPEDLLDWDKPLSQQSEKVRKAVRSLTEADSPLTGEYRRMVGDALQPFEQNSTTGETIVRLLGGDKEASDILRERGIKGIRYLDAGSRGAGQGSYNYVIFDDKIIKILERGGSGPAMMAALVGAGVAGTIAAKLVKQYATE